MLVQRGADLQQKTSKGRTALEFAWERNDLNDQGRLIIEFLSLEEGGKRYIYFGRWVGAFGFSWGELSKSFLKLFLEWGRTACSLLRMLLKWKSHELTKPKIDRYLVASWCEEKQDYDHANARLHDEPEIESRVSRGCFFCGSFGSQGGLLRLLAFPPSLPFSWFSFLFSWSFWGSMMSDRKSLRYVSQENMKKSKSDG